MSAPEQPPTPQSRHPSALDDLLATRESAPRAPRSSSRPGAGRLRRGAQHQGETRSLFGEILDWMLAPLLLMWPLSIGFTFIVARSLADAPFDRALIDHANVFVRQIQIVDNRSVVRNPRGLRDLLGRGTEDTLFFQISKADGALLAGEKTMPSPTLYDFPAPGRIKLRTDQFRGQEVRIAYTYMDNPDDTVVSADFPVLVQIAETLDMRVALANEIIKGVIFPQFIILPLAVALVWFGLSRGLAPLNQLQQRIRERRPDDLSPIDPRGAPEEIAPLVAAFNELLGRLDDSFGSQKRFIR
jgi:two-component system sensor histidine kinase TctE